MNQIINCISKYESYPKEANADMIGEIVSDYENFYRLYEYTDDICVLEDSELYPGLINYVKTGLLTEEQLKEALEYDKNLER